MASENIRSPGSGDDDAKLLASLGYTQELSRRMSGFSNFAISFAIICVLAGGITAFPQALGAGGGLSIGLGWPIGALFSVVVALAMAQIASAYPTAGGLYHWSSILGGKGWGWATAWFNLIGLIFAMASIDFGLYDPFFKSFIAPLLGVKVDALGWGAQTLFIGVCIATQALLNQYAPRITMRLTDLSGWLIFAVVIVLIGSLLATTPVHLDLSRLFTFTNYTGTEGSPWPQSSSAISVFLSGLLLTIYTITGFDASAHTAEETHNASKAVPKGIITSVVWSVIFGYVLICTFVLVMPNVAQGVKQGGDFFSALLAPLPAALRVALGVAIFIINYLCALAALTSTSRMMYAFARDGGLPASGWLRQINAKRATPGPGIWVTAALAMAATLYGDAFVVLSTGCAVLLYLSYIMPTAAGVLAEGRSWTRKGPFDLGSFSKPVGTLAVIGGAILVFTGVRPPNEKVLYLVIGMAAALLVLWWGAGVRNRFRGPPLNESISNDSPQHTINAVGE
ncbi:MULTISPECIES: amino acid permease [unclassified Paraburkholderia]|uniref:amino acid permease n=1 Tax=unclassified Paraburkholderia TaxID=2615204 RepID=UPI002AB15040|nr:MULTISPECIES: amino acid permease [unclassified Paraburkholderia]